MPDGLDPLSGSGYAFWSGLGSVVVPLWIGLMLYFAPTRCQELGCRRRARARHPLHGWPVCPRHLRAADDALAALASQEKESRRPPASKRAGGD